MAASDELDGWRANKAQGGILIDVEANEVITHSLSMPHSPRWYADRLWLLESGGGSLGHVDLATGRYEPIVRLAGFARGLDFWGDLAFVGLSQVGFDDPRLDTLFLALPVSWKGPLIQYAGRLHGHLPEKTDVRIHDYVDSGIPLLEAMFRKRLRGYRATGYAVGQPTGPSAGR